MATGIGASPLTASLSSLSACLLAGEILLPYPHASVYAPLCRVTRGLPESHHPFLPVAVAPCKPAELSVSTQHLASWSLWNSPSQGASSWCRPLYLITNMSGREYPRWANHFDPYSPIYSRRERSEILISDCALGLAFSGLFSLAKTFGWLWLAKVSSPCNARPLRHHLLDAGALRCRKSPEMGLTGTLLYTASSGTMVACTAPRLCAFWAATSGMAAVPAQVYIAPYLIVNMWLVMITLLQHTHPSLPHYSDQEWEWLRGALSTVDRSYGLLDIVFHHIADTHVCHHLFSAMPHYHAQVSLSSPYHIHSVCSSGACVA